MVKEPLRNTCRLSLLPQCLIEGLVISGMEELDLWTVSVSVTFASEVRDPQVSLACHISNDEDQLLHRLHNEGV